ncbi:MAG: archaellin/type IV pilin N-terminal domain-containing protein [Candidatus Pacearchaeota archaeon]
MAKDHNKRAISPVIATVLLIVVAIALFLLIFFWIRGFQKEAVLKYGTPVETVCSNVRYEGSYTAGTLQVTNTGSVVISKVSVFITSGSSTKLAGNLTNIQPASSSTYTGGSGCTKIKLVPYLLGQTKSGAYREVPCNNQVKVINCG